MWLTREPARTAGLGELHQLLEGGFDTFKAMRGATEFLALVDERERRLMSALMTRDKRSRLPRTAEPEHPISLLP